MPVQKIHLKREFILERGQQSITLPDPDPVRDANGVMRFYSDTYPELATASVVGPEIKNDKEVWRFRSIAGTKG